MLLGKLIVAIEDVGDALELRTDDGGRVRAAMVINAAGLWADEVAALAGDRSFSLTPRKGQIAITHKAPWLDRIVLPVPGKLTKGILAAPTVFGGVLLGPTAEEIEDKGDTATSAAGLARILEGASRLVPALADAVTVRQYAGLRAVHSGGDYLIRASTSIPRLLHVAGIRSTGPSTSPAIGRYVAALVADMLGLAPANRRADAPVSVPAGGDDQVICLCRGITRWAILAALGGPLPATTLDGLKRRTRALWGECQGSICLPRILELCVEARGVPVTEIQRACPAPLWSWGRLRPYRGLPKTGTASVYAQPQRGWAGLRCHTRWRSSGRDSRPWPRWGPGSPTVRQCCSTMLRGSAAACSSAGRPRTARIRWRCRRASACRRRSICGCSPPRYASCPAPAEPRMRC